ncbi:MAG TPA: L,D-transpeptidase [Flavobacteriales bacterium]|jgi:hypothetical protein|nr:L,D-transpeptidase [Flavobacteriales bacterium]
MRGLLVLPVLFLAFVDARSQGPAVSQPRKQGIIELLLDYLEVRYPGHDLNGDLLYISIQRQALFHVRERRLMNEYPVSTASRGPGSAMNSFQTPTGLHRIVEKHGDAVPPLGILRDRTFTGTLADLDFAGVDKDWITSRILWLDGLEPGVNNGSGVDSRERHIYIHGTANERSVGTPSSMGCVRMLNPDVIRLYDQIPVGALVVILDN